MAEIPFPVLLQQAGLKINWALEQRQNLARILGEYAQHGIALIPVEEAPTFTRIRFVAQPVPYQAAMLVGNSLHALRSALDTAVSRLYHEAVGEFDKRINFPIHKTERELKALFDTGNGKKIRDRIPDLETLVMTQFKPWKDGNFDLWALSKLDNIQKHQVIPLIVGGAAWRVDEISRGGSLLRNLAIMLDLGQETTLGVGGNGPLKIDAVGHPALQCPVIEEFFPNRSFEDVLHQLTEQVMGVVHTLETHFKRSDAD